MAATLGMLADSHTG